MRRAVDITVGRTTAEDLMREALALTEGTHPHPNPRVGAVIVSEEGDIVARGAHRRPGEAHAERLAIDGRRFPGATMVVTLEPCNHTGRTPPCTEAIIDAGIAKVLVGAVDPDDRVAGSGIATLRQAGIEVVAGILSDDVEARDPAYFHHRRTGRPRYTVKIASTLDGQAAAADGTSRWITGEESRRDVHETRAQHDAVMVGAGTILADDPSLDVRLDDLPTRQPRPVVVTGRRRIPEDARVLGRDPLIVDGTDDEGGLDAVDAAIAEAGLLSVLVEGGPTLARSMIASGRADEILWYTAAKLGLGTGRPAIAGSFTTLSEAIDLEFGAVEPIGGDLKITARIAGSTQCSPE